MSSWVVPFSKEGQKISQIFGREATFFGGQSLFGGKRNVWGKTFFFTCLLIIYQHLVRFIKQAKYVKLGCLIFKEGIENQLFFGQEATLFGGQALFGGKHMVWGKIIDFFITCLPIIYQQLKDERINKYLMKRYRKMSHQKSDIILENFKSYQNYR